MWWFVEGLGGESQSRTSLWSWSPATEAFISIDGDQRKEKQTFDLIHIAHDLLEGGYNTK
jgi:hypothetical protein